MQRHLKKPGYRHSITLSGLLALILALTACSNASSGPTAQQIISNAQAAMQKITSYHFDLVADHPGSGGLIVVTSANGDILVPDKLQANANALVLGNVVQVQIIAIGDQQYVTDPVTGKWSRSGGLLDPRTLSDPKTGVSAIVGHLQNPSTPTDSTVDGVSCWSINGKLDAKYLTAITGGGTPSGTLVNTTLCIGKKDNLPYLIRISGMTIQGDTNQTVRTFKLSKFGEPLTIVAPIS